MFLTLCLIAHFFSCLVYTHSQPLSLLPHFSLLLLSFLFTLLAFLGTVPFFLSLHLAFSDDSTFLILSELPCPVRFGAFVLILHCLVLFPSLVLCSVLSHCLPPVSSPLPVSRLSSPAALHNGKDRATLSLQGLAGLSMHLSHCEYLCSLCTLTVCFLLLFSSQIPRLCLTCEFKSGSMC